MPAAQVKPNLVVKNLGVQEYATCFKNMQAHTLARIETKKQQESLGNSEAELPPNELWLVEHPSVYTLGQAGDPVHILNADNIPVVQTDRGGQVTWHGEGQLVAYFLFDIEALDWHVRKLVSNAEEIICKLLTPYLKPNIFVKPRKDAPGVYVFERIDESEIQLGKIASLGFKIKRGLSYHGVAINIHADLQAFSNINPCGYAGMTMLNLTDVCTDLSKIQFKKLQDEFSAIVQSYHG